MIYLDHAATTPMRREALEAMLPFFSDSFANASSGYAAARTTRAAIDCARRQTAQAIGAKPGEIYFTSGGTEANNWAIAGFARANPGKRHIITTAIEHHAVLHVCDALAADGFEITQLQSDASGAVSVREFEQAIRPDTLLVSVMLANNETGVIQPVGEIAQIAHAHGAAVHTDAIQAVGHIAVDVRALNVDFLSMSAHKFGGPKGIGALYVRAGTRVEPLIHGGAQERNMRAGTENTPAVVGMGCAIELACAEMETAAQKVSSLRNEMEAQLKALPGVRINGGCANRLPGHLHASFVGISTQMMMMRLDMAGIAASSGSACTSGSVQPSHVMRAMGLAGKQQADIRFTFGENNTKDDIAAAIGALRQILNR